MPSYLPLPAADAPAMESVPIGGMTFQDTTSQFAIVSATPYSAAANACSTLREFWPARFSSMADMKKPETRAPTTTSERIVSSRAMPRSSRSRGM